MLVNPKTIRITALLDFEFRTSCRPNSPTICPGGLYSAAGHRGELGKAGIPGSLRAAEGAVYPRNGARRGQVSPTSWGVAPLGSNAGVVGQFNVASRSSFDVDQIYWEVLYKEGLGEAMLDTAILAGKEEFLKRKKDQFEAYWAEKQNNARFN